MKAKAAALLELRRRHQHARHTVALIPFKHKLYPHYQHAPHLDALDTALEQVSRFAATGGREGIGRLIVEMPPRHGKTVTTSRLFPAWHIGMVPDHRIMLVSYAQSLSVKNSRAVRAFVRSRVFQETFPGVRLSDDSASADAWDIAGYEGGIDAIGMLGAATGKGANLLIIDDPVKSRQEAESGIIRERVWEGYTDNLMTRLEPGGAVVLLMTRWHTDDLIGRVLKYSTEPWTRLRFPALAEGDDPLGRQQGEPLWPERFGLAVLKTIEENIGTYSWSALYQQNPISSEGGLFKRAWFYPLIESPPPLSNVVRYWDLAMSAKTTADYSVGVKMGIGTDGHYYILDVVRKQIDWGELVEWMTSVIQGDSEDCIQGIEQAGYMSRAIQELNLDPRLRGYRIFGYPKETDKVTSALPLVSRFAAGVVHLIDAHWTENFVQELCVFDKGEHDDQVDASAGAYAMLSGGSALGELNPGPSWRISEW